MTASRPTAPGYLPPGEQPEVFGMIGTAGHVDHGKTSLVTLLTGCPTDRLKEEQERGLTIELGFAPCFLGQNLCVGVVDVPGHERFVRTMVAGVSGIDLTLFVIAADDGVMPQTAEHLQILELLGVRHGLVALTKIDLVTPDVVARRREEIAAFLEGSFLEGAPILPVSAETGEGYGEFYEVLVTRLRALSRRSRAGVFRMPVERVFSRAGFGAVVSGIPVEGRIQIGDAVSLSPGGQEGRVRGIQCFLRQASEAGAGQCVALNVPEWGKTPPQRGQVIVPAGYQAAASLLYVELQTTPLLDTPLQHAETVRLHTGTAEVTARLFLLDGPELPGGVRAAATVSTAQPVAAAAGDRFVLRRLSPAATVAGGCIRIADAHADRPRRAQMRERMLEWERCFEQGASAGDPAQRVAYAVLCRGTRGCTPAEAARDSLLPLETAAHHCAALLASGRLRPVHADAMVHADVWQAARKAFEERLQSGRAAGRLTLSVTDARRGLDRDRSGIWSAICDELAAEGLLARNGDTLLLQASVEKLPAADREQAERILALYEQTGYQSPHPRTVAELLEIPAEAAEKLLEFLVQSRRLVRVAPTVLLGVSHYRAAQDHVVETLRSGGELQSPAFRDHLRTSRKYAMSILDYMDAQRITMRQGNARSLLHGYEQRLWT